MESKSIEYPLGFLSSIDAETFGEPGKRTFRLIMKSGKAVVIVWMEKEHFFQNKWKNRVIFSLIFLQNRENVARVSPNP